MAIIKCKMCGGDLNLVEGASTAECEYCGSVQTVPKVDDEKKLTLFARANRLRVACEFDKATGIYESIVADFPEEAEAYWGLVLCKYGIEYVDDPATGKKIPTCHRSSFDSIMEDSDFEQALENADAVARKVYREEAKTIEEIRKGIIAVSNNEQPYDIFICYKETAENGDRTLDSVLAQDVYDALTGKGYRVFFSRITLEDKLGMEYEPYIFAALNSAKIMLTFGTDYEYFNAVWVKNEWSRFLKLMAKDKKKHLIPCFKGIDAYDMPKEFARLQAQDLGKVGAIQDLLRGIEKILLRQTETVKETLVVQQSAVVSNPTVDSFLKRAFMFLEDGDWKSADEYCEKVLDQDPENAQAYLGKLMAECHVRQMDGLKDCANPFDQSGNYQKAVHFADEPLKDTLTGYNTHINTRNENKRLEIKHQAERTAKRIKKTSLIVMPIVCTIIALVILLTSVIIPNRKYDCAKALMESGENEKAAIAFGALGDYRDASSQSLALWEKVAIRESLCAGDAHTVGLCADGTVIACGKNHYDQCSVYFWKDIVAISAGYNHTVGLKADGTVVAVGCNDQSQCDVSSWTDIVAISAGYNHTVGLKADGTVVAVGCNDQSQCDVSSWTDIVAISAGYNHTVGLKADGTVVVVGSNKQGQCDVSSWTDIVAIGAGWFHTIGLKADGTIVVVGNNNQDQCDVLSWTDIVAISAGCNHTVGLKADGTVVAVGDNYYGECNVSSWINIVSICAGAFHTIGLKSDGTVVAVGQNTSDQCNVDYWSDINIP